MGVSDIDLADFGRKELSIAETEMPGLKALWFFDSDDPGAIGGVGVEFCLGCC